MTSEATVSAEVKEFLKQHGDAQLTDSGKVRCAVTGHEMPSKLEALEQHFNGKRYKNAKERSQYDFAMHEPWIVAHKKNPHLLYCTLTKKPVTKQAKAVEGHINGKKYKRLLAEALNPTEKKVSKKRERELAFGGDGGARATDGAEGADDGDELEDVEADDDLEEEGEDGDEEELEEVGGDGDVVLEDDDDAAEFLEEGPFWERDDDDDDKEEEELEGRDEEDLGGGDEAEGSASERFTRPKIAVAETKADGSASAASSKKADGVGKAEEMHAKRQKPKKRPSKEALPTTVSPNLASVKPKDKTRMPPPMSLQSKERKGGSHEPKKRKVQKS